MQRHGFRGGDIEKFCRGCRNVRWLAPEQHRGPTSCEACGETELWPENEEAWTLIGHYPSLIRADGVDYQSARFIATEFGKDPLWLFEQLEAIRKGLMATHDVKQSAHPDRDRQ